MPKSWRDVLKIHPAAEMFDPLPPDELRELGKDIKAHDLTSPIVLWSDGKSPAVLLDGRNRLDAIEIAIGAPVIIGPPSLTAGEAFLACNKVIVLGRSVDPVAYVISTNIHRRHLKPEKKRELIAKLLKRDPTQSDRQIAETVKVSPTTVGTVRAKMEATGDVSKLDTRTDSKGRQQPAKKTPPGRVPHSATVTYVRAGTTEARTDTGENIEAAIYKPKPKAATTKARRGRDDIGPESAGELARKDDLIKQLQDEVRRLEIKIKGYGSEIEEAKAAATNKVKAAPIDSTAYHLARRLIKQALSRCPPRFRPDLFRAFRQLLDRLENGEDQHVVLEDEDHKPAAAPQPADDSDDIPDFLLRTAP
jgi:DNA-binding Lrp family transcriptional regulator